MARNYFITGGAGFIGSNYVHRLVQRGENVTVYDNFIPCGRAEEYHLAPGIIRKRCF